jgi:glycosyltransferase involved in cell wall biosynthesis
MHTFSTNRATTQPTLKFRIKKLAYHLVMWVAVKRSKKIIVPTKVVKESFLDFYKFLKPKKIVIAPEGIDPDFAKDTSKEFEQKTLEKYRIGKKYLLYISSMYRHKNVPQLIDAFEKLKDDYGYSGQLILVGKKDYFSKQIEEYIKEKGLEDSVLLPGMQNYVEDQEVTALRKNAEVYVFPSLQEGFSLTPLEGMIWGLPAVISDIPCHKEVYGESVIYFDPNSTKDMAEKINNVLQNPKLREELKEKGYKRVEMYDWKKTAEITHQVFLKSLN